eukprot:535524_1
MGKTGDCPPDTRTLSKGTTTTLTPCPLPHLGHFSYTDYDEFYEPREDTYLLMDVLNSEVKTWKEGKDRSGRQDNLNEEDQQRPLIILEIGSGSGVVITSVARILGSKRAICYASEVNMNAALATSKTARANGATVDVICDDLATLMGDRLRGEVDVLIFNPPYVPTHLEEVSDRGITAAWAGGPRGRVVIDRALDLVPSLLSFPNGTFYLVVVEENEPEDIMKRMGSIGFESQIIGHRKAQNERLSVLKFSYKN